MCAAARRRSHERPRGGPRVGPGLQDEFVRCKDVYGAGARTDRPSVSGGRPDAGRRREALQADSMVPLVNSSMARSLGQFRVPRVEIPVVKIPHVQLPNLAAFVEALKKFDPPNWHGLEATSIGSIVDVMDETGWCLVWCPRATVVERVVAAESNRDRVAALLASKVEIIEDVRDCNRGISMPASGAHASGQSFQSQPRLY